MGLQPLTESPRVPSEFQDNVASSFPSCESRPLRIRAWNHWRLFSVRVLGDILDIPVMSSEGELRLSCLSEQAEVFVERVVSSVGPPQGQSVDP